jgi:transcriptional regulator with XRE-family HTH domain
MQTILQKVARNVKRIRNERGLSQQALADKVHIHRVYLAKIEGAIQAPSLEILESLAKALKVKPGELLE